MEKLTPQEIEDQIATRPEWTRSGDALQRTFRFENFKESMAFVNRISDLAERVQHHPDIMIRYNKVTLTLETHDTGGLTARDFEFATETDRMMLEV